MRSGARKRLRRLAPAALALAALTPPRVLAQGAAFEQASARPRLSADGAPEAVFRWSSQRCDDLHIPDSPARAIRAADGVALMAAHHNNILLTGRDFDSLAPVCAAASRGSEDPNPGAFDDRFWVQALAPLPDGRVLGLASHEYMGGRHAGSCAVNDGRPTSRCWYSAIIATAAQAGSWRFRPLPPPERVVAASPSPYDPAAPRRSGFFSVTNVVFEGGFAYVMAYVEGVPGQRGGMCLLRAPQADLVSGWRALARGEFRLPLGPPPRAREACDVVGGEAFDGPVRSVVRLGQGGPWAAIFAGRPRERVGGGPAGDGVFYSLSPDLLRWSAPELLLAATPFTGQPGRGLYFQYPSLIDHASPSPVFDTVGDAPHLYLTRFNLAEDRRRGSDRDLVRIPVKVAR